MRIEVGISPATPIHPWMDHAACIGHDPELWFTNPVQSNRRHEQALAICGLCTVKPQCLKLANRERHDYGIYGGLTPRQRQDQHTTTLRKGVTQ